MHWLILSASPARGAQWLAALENLDEHWRGTCAEDAAALHRRCFDACLLCDDAAGWAAAALLAEQPPLAVPWVAAAFPCPQADVTVSPAGLAMLPGQLAAVQAGPCLPKLALLRHGQITCLARGLTHALDIPPHLTASAFLPDMAALTVVHPPLLSNLRGRLYPLTARRHGATPAAIERSLRLMIEATWKVGSLPALERFFGHSVDPEKGKPTNREFLFRVQERLTLAAMRVQKSPLPDAGGRYGTFYSAGTSSAGVSSTTGAATPMAAWASAE